MSGAIYEQRGSPVDPDEPLCEVHGPLADGEIWIDGEGLWWCSFCLVPVQPPGDADADELGGGL